MNKPKVKRYNGGKPKYITDSGQTFMFDDATGDMILDDGTRAQMTLPEVTVTRRDPRKYVSAYHPEDVAPFFDALTGGLGHMVNPFALAEDASRFVDKPSFEQGWKVAEYGLPFSKTGRFLLGAYNLGNENGIAKTYDLANSGEYGRAALSGLGDILNAAMMIEGGAGASKQLRNKLDYPAMRVLESVPESEFQLPQIRINPKGLYRRAKNVLLPKKHKRLEDIGLSWDDYSAKQQKIINDLTNFTHPLEYYAYRDFPRFFVKFGEGDVKTNPGGWTQSTTPIGVRIGDSTVTGNATVMRRQPSTRTITADYSVKDGQHTWTADNPNDLLPTKYGTETTDVLSFPIENNPEFNKALAEHIAELEREAGAPVVGSSRLISEGYFGGVPGDVEMVAPLSALDEVKNRLGFRFSRTTRGDTGVTGSSPKVMRSTEANNLDINTLNDSGTIIHQMESTRRPNKMPVEYSKTVKDRVSADLKIPKDDGSGFYTADEYFDLIKNDPDLLTQSVVDNAFKSTNPKHGARAFVMMNNDNPRVVNGVSTAIDHIVAQIPGMKRFSDIYKSQSFNDVAKNKEIL